MSYNDAADVIKTVDIVHEIPEKEYNNYWFGIKTDGKKMEGNPSMFRRVAGRIIFGEKWSKDHKKVW